MPVNSTEIGWETQYTTETRPWAVDVGPSLDPGDIAATPTAAIFDLLTGLDVSSTCLAGSPTVVGTVITQTVFHLTAGRRYRLMLTANMGGTKETSQPVLIRCPY